MRRVKRLPQQTLDPGHSYAGSMDHWRGWSKSLKEAKASLQHHGTQGQLHTAKKRRHTCLGHVPQRTWSRRRRGGRHLSQPPFALCRRCPRKWYSTLRLLLNLGCGESRQCRS